MSRFSRFSLKVKVAFIVSFISGVALAVGQPLTNQQLRASAVVTSNTSTGSSSQQVQGSTASGSSQTGNPVLTAGIGYTGATYPTNNTNNTVRTIAVAADGPVFTRPGGPVTWSCSLDNIGATLTQCQAGDVNGFLNIVDIIAQSTTSTAGTFVLRYGTGANCGTGTTSFFPASGATARFVAPANTAAPTVIHFNQPIRLPYANAVCLLGVATNTTTIVINGFTSSQ